MPDLVPASPTAELQMYGAADLELFRLLDPCCAKAGLLMAVMVHMKIPGSRGAKADTGRRHPAST